MYYILSCYYLSQCLTRKPPSDPLQSHVDYCCNNSSSCIQVEPPGTGDALRSLRLADSTGTSLWWRSYVSYPESRSMHCRGAHLPCPVKTWTLYTSICASITIHSAVSHAEAAAAAGQGPRQLINFFCSSEMNIDFRAERYNDWRVAHMQGRNRRCMTLDLRKEEAREVVLKLSHQSDALIENFRPGVMEKWELGPKVSIVLQQVGCRQALRSWTSKFAEQLYIRREILSASHVAASRHTSELDAAPHAHAEPHQSWPSIFWEIDAQPAAGLASRADIRTYIRLRSDRAKVTSRRLCKRV